MKGVEEPLAEAEELVNLLYAQRQLENACLDRSIDDIEIAMEKIKSGKTYVPGYIFSALKMNIINITGFLVHLKLSLLLSFYLQVSS